MFEMKLAPDSSNPTQNILELKIKAPTAPEPTLIPAIQIPTIIYIDDTIQEDQIPVIAHALTDTVNRVTWPEQIQLITSKYQFPKHLETVNLQNEDIFQVATTKVPCNLVVITNSESKDLKRQIAKASEFVTTAHAVKPTTTVELIDNLNDHIKPLKQKTIVNLKIEIELDNSNTLSPLNYIPKLTNEANKYFANLIDLASQEEKAYVFSVNASSAIISYAYEDLLLQRLVQGGHVLAL